MFQSKNIAWIIIAVIIFYIGSAYKETLDEINVANNDFNNKDKKPAWMQKNIEKSRAVQKNKEANMQYFVKSFHERHGHDEKSEKALKSLVHKKFGMTYYGSVNSGDIRAEQVVLTPLKYIDISGSIDSNMKYIVYTRYKATVDKSECRFSEWSFWGGHQEGLASKKFEYTPDINGTHHHVSVPIRILNPDDKCGYKLLDVSLHMALRTGAENLNSYYKVPLFTNDRDFAEQFQTVMSYGINMRETKRTIDIECLSPSSYGGGDFHPCLQKPLKQARAIVRYIPKIKGTYEINIKKVPLWELSEDEVHDILVPKRRRNYGSNKASGIRF